MNAESIINQAIARGEEEGMMALAPVEQVVFAVAEAEVYCDMEGVDALLEKYGGDSVTMFAHAFAAIGANEIAAGFAALGGAPPSAREELLSRLNGLITKRHEYTYESIQGFVEQRMSTTADLPVHVQHVGRGGYVGIDGTDYPIEHVEQGVFVIHFPGGNTPVLQSHLDALHRYAGRQEPKWFVENRSKLCVEGDESRSEDE